MTTNQVSVKKSFRSVKQNALVVLAVLAASLSSLGCNVEMTPELQQKGALGSPIDQPSQGDCCADQAPACDSYNPCDGKSPGDTCSLCPPGATSCVETTEVRVCDTGGRCGANVPRCLPPAPSCDGVICQTGEHCELQDVACETAPCWPAPACVVDSCPDPLDPSVHYIDGSDQDNSICFLILFHCAEGQTLFSNECGCGCIDE